MYIPQELPSEGLMILIQILVVTVGGFVVNFIKTKIGTEKYNQYYMLVKTVISSIEQTSGGGNGVNKKQQAIESIKNMTKGKLSDELIEKLVESAVFEMNLVLKPKTIEK